MEATRVIARAFRGEPLSRVAVHHENGLVYITTPDRIDAVKTGDWSPTGFPEEDIFLYNSDTYKELRAQWELERKTSPQSWRGLCRYNIRSQ